MTLEEARILWEKKNGGKAAHSEHDLQVACVRWFRLQYPQYAKLLFAIPNGGQRNEIVAAKLKAEGVVAGVPDLCLAVPKHGYHGLWIEMKNGKAGRLSKHQEVMIESLRAEGYRVAVCKNFEEFERMIIQYI